jgi:hypothetical protein
VKNSKHADRQKITVKVPTELLERAQKISGTGISDTIRKGLEILAAHWAYEQRLRKEDKLKASIDRRDLRKDRD